jgi:hypothetical protein
MNVDENFFLLGLTIGALIMGLGLTPLVTRFRNIVVGFQNTISTQAMEVQTLNTKVDDLTAQLAAAVAAAADPADVQAAADLTALADAVETGNPIP